MVSICETSIIIVTVSQSWLTLTRTKQIFCRCKHSMSLPPAGLWTQYCILMNAFNSCLGRIARPPLQVLSQKRCPLKWGWRTQQWNINKLCSLDGIQTNLHHRMHHKRMFVTLCNTKRRCQLVACWRDSQRRLESLIPVSTVSVHEGSPQH